MFGVSARPDCTNDGICGIPTSVSGTYVVLFITFGAFVEKTGTGKLRRQQAMRQHLFEKKSSRRKRRLEQDQDVHPGDAKKIKRLLAER